jgi:hypothetical protein
VRMKKEETVEDLFKNYELTQGKDEHVWESC